MRVTSSLWVSAFIRRVSAEGAYVTVISSGAEGAGAIFIVVNNLQGELSLYGPAPQSFFETDKPDERCFCLSVGDISQQEIDQKLESERRFDPDIWVIEVEDRLGRPFIDIVEDI